MSAHTPGPWRVADDGVVLAREVAGDVECWGTVAKPIGTMDDATKLANAALIARAPDQCEALRKIHAIAFKARDRAYNHGPVLKDFLREVEQIAAGVLS